MTIAFQLITSAAALGEFCEHAQGAEFIAVDTEFVRTRTYFARLGLVQIQAGERTALIDPVALAAEDDGQALLPLWQLLADPQTTLVIHAGGEDYEILHQHMGQLPNAIFDTQIASAMLGDGDALGYAALVEQRLGVAIDKSQSRTDWMKRPLAPEQLDYAAADVFYLQQLYPELYELAQTQGKLELILQESAWQAHKRAQTIPDEWQFLYFGNAWQCDPEQLSVLRELVAWRYQRARSSDLPLGFIAKDHTLLDLARQMPDSKNKLRYFKELSPVTIKYAGDALLGAIAKGRDNGPLDIPLLRLTDLPNYKTMFNAIKKLAQQTADELGINVALIASRRQINDVLHWCWQIRSHAQDQLPLPDLFTSWRGAKLKQPIEQLLK
ncbi:ribonuclease D [Pseudidiomarina sp. 1APR75-33.1]|uniref:ribonuclease D n=1 Tax=Pseudidiomarina terrestris TaxID=2820060 RepID=UPI00264C400E|nr:ribonuclease D [Pseudidiomarina sp. 1APR75-33.1]MDN7127746.1 ribonuclease D [Pseudidiomarina sp. 1APR75-33.1]